MTSSKHLERLKGEDGRAVSTARIAAGPSEPLPHSLPHSLDWASPTGGPRGQRVSYLLNPPRQHPPHPASSGSLPASSCWHRGQKFLFPPRSISQHVYDIFFIYSFFDENSGCSHIWATVNDAAMNPGDLLRESAAPHLNEESQRVEPQEREWNGG